MQRGVKLFYKYVHTLFFLKLKSLGYKVGGIYSIRYVLDQGCAYSSYPMYSIRSPFYTQILRAYTFYKSFPAVCGLPYYTLVQYSNPSLPFNPGRATLPMEDK